MRQKNKGFILIVVMIFSVVAMITTIALFKAITLTFKVAGVEQMERIKGYYAAIAGLRYANVMLQDPNIMNLLTAVGSSVTRSVKDDYFTLYSDLHLSDPHNVTIKITYNADDTYTAVASYSL